MFQYTAPTDTEVAQINAAFATLNLNPCRESRRASSVKDPAAQECDDAYKRAQTAPHAAFFIKPPASSSDQLPIAVPRARVKKVVQAALDSELDKALSSRPKRRHSDISSEDGSLDSNPCKRAKPNFFECNRESSSSTTSDNSTSCTKSFIPGP